MASRRTKLPHFIQKHDWDCGIACIQMILLKLQKVTDDLRIYALRASLELPERLWTIDLANILRQFEIEPIYYTKTCRVDPSHGNLEFYKNDFAAEKMRVDSLFQKATEMGIEIVKKSITMEDIFSMLDDGYIAIVLVDSSNFTCYFCVNSVFLCNSQDQFQGHYILLSGYDTKAGVIYCKNPSFDRAECTVSITVFDNARKHRGTDEDIIFVNMKIE